MRKFPHEYWPGAGPVVGALTIALLVSATALPAQRAGAPTAQRASPTASAAEAVREQTADQQVRHALNRLAFGARPGDVERVRAVGVDRWIAQQLEPARIDDRSTERFVARFPTLSMGAAELFREYPLPQVVRAQQRAPRQRANVRGGASTRADDTMSMISPADSARYRRAARESQRILAELQTAKVARAVISERQLEEVMVDFWQNHFSVFAGKGPERYFLPEYDRQAIRPHALGSFRELLGATARSSAMLFYLDNWQSTAEGGRPAPGGRRRGLNENYARELLELHTIGVDGGYTQQDVIDVARAFTGWTLEQPRQSGEFLFRPRMHDAKEKVVLGHTLRAGRGIEDGEEVLDILAQHPATARFIATKLARRFVSDAPPPQLVERAAAAFQRTNGDIREVVRTIVTSPEFFSRAAYRSKVKSPFELVVSALRAVGAEPDSTPRTAQIVARLGQPLFLHQAPNGYPETGASWISTGAILNRINFGMVLAAGRVPGASIQRWTERAHLSTALHDRQVDGTIASILGGEASPDTRRVLESGQNPLAEPAQVTGSAEAPSREERRQDAASAGADSGRSRASDDAPDMAGGGRPRGPGGRDPFGGPIHLDGIAKIVGLALGSPEFQRR